METSYRNRRATSLENSLVRVTVLAEGGHVAEIADKKTGVNPLWTPPWPPIEPSTYDAAKHPEYGPLPESRLLSGIMGHNLCLDIFGGPSPEEEAAGLGVHGEASVVPYSLKNLGDELTAVAYLPEAGLRVERRLRLAAESSVVRFIETVENLRGTDRPVGWTQHVTLGPPFLENGATAFRLPGTRSRTFESDFAGEHSRHTPGADFDWPHAPLKSGGTEDLRVYSSAPVSGAFTATLMDPGREQAYFLAWSPRSKVLFGYVWRRTDFPWLGRWEENRSRAQPPWNGRTMTLGMEFGASPIPETRRRMIERGRLFGAPCFRWIPARSRVTVEYCAFVTAAETIPEAVAWDGGAAVRIL